MIFFVVIYSGKCECALFGDYVDEVKRKVDKSTSGLPIVIVQYAKVKIFRGNSIVFVMSFMLILMFDWLFDHEVIVFRKGFSSECEQYY
jgi:hypothetical protein